MILKAQTLSNYSEAFRFTMITFISINVLTLLVIGFIGMQDHMFAQSILGWILLSFAPSLVGMSLVYYQQQREIRTIVNQRP